MNEDNINNLRLKDTNLRDAIRQEEMERPQMPSDLNARLMVRMEQEERGSQKTRSRIVWPWIAAACVAAVIAVFLTPPKGGDNGGDTTATETPKVAEVQPKPEPQEKIEEVKEVQPVPEQKTKERKAPTQPQRIELTCSRGEELIAQINSLTETIIQDEPAPEANELAVAETPHPKQVQPKALTERDLPVTRPENFKYTKEELELMKQQANEAYLKWVELELEITRYNLEQTAER